MKRSSHFAYLLAGISLLALAGGCSSLPKEPEAPTLPAQMFAPPMPPRVVALPERKAPPPPKDGIVRLTAANRVGASYHVAAGEDRVYPLSVGLGTDTSGPQQAAVELPPGEQVQFVTFPNENLLAVEQVKMGNARDWRWIVFIKPKENTGGPRVENVSIITEKRHIRVDVSIKPGRVNNLTLKLTDPGGSEPASMTSGIAADALCLDNAFSWDRSTWWAPTQVCALAAPNGIYQTLIYMPPNVQDFPVVHVFADRGDGVVEPGIVNYRVSGNVIYVDGVHASLRLTGQAAPIDIIRGGS